MSGKRNRKESRKQQHGFHASTVSDGVSAQESTGVPEHEQPELAASEKKESEKRWKLFKKPDPSDLAVWGLVIAVLAAVIYGLQFWQMFKQNQISQENTQAVQRAFLYVDTFEWIPNRNVSDPNKIDAFTFYPQVRNSGATPALHAAGWFNFWHSSEPIDDKFDFPDLDRNGNRIKAPRMEGFYPPQTTQDINVPAEVPGTLAVETGKTQHLYFYGWLHYRDVFSGTPMHTTLYCMEVLEFRRVSAHDNVGPSITLRTQTCPNLLHYCVDEQCQAKQAN